MYGERKEKKQKVTILLREDIYEALDAKGVFKTRRFSELMNRLLYDYLQNETINSMENYSKNFIANTIEESMAKAVADAEEKLAHVYSSSIYSSLLLKEISDLTTEEFEEVKRKTKQEKRKFVTGMDYEESFLGEEKTVKNQGNNPGTTPGNRPGQAANKPVNTNKNNNDDLMIDISDLVEDE